MVEMKYRAWDGEKMWTEITGFECTSGTVDGIFLDGDYHNIKDEQIEVLRFTGLRDKDGKEIYEGSIVITKDYPFYGDDPCEKELNYVGEVFWDEEGLRWCYEMHVVSDRVRGAACGDTLCNWKHDDKNSSDWEVIGNIYENPELLLP